MNEELLFIGAPTEEDIEDYPFQDSADILNHQTDFYIPEED